MASQHTFGWKRPAVDLRDAHFSSTQFRALAELPPLIDMRDKFPGVFDQGQIGDCVENASVALRMYYEQEQVEGSRLALYSWVRLMTGTPLSEDSGSSLRDGCKAMAKYGVCPESDFPDVAANFSQVPSDKAVADAAPYRIASYASVGNAALAHASLANGDPVIIGLDLYESFESDAVAKTGLVPLPQEGEQLAGGHALTIVGIDMSKKIGSSTGAFLVRNSWGPSWGCDEGHCWIPLDYFGPGWWGPTLCGEMWQITPSNPIPPAPPDPGPPTPTPPSPPPDPGPPTPPPDPTPPAPAGGFAAWLRGLWAAILAFFGG
jgi:hypothetical protein